LKTEYLCFACAKCQIRTMSLYLFHDRIIIKVRTWNGNIMKAVCVAMFTSYRAFHRFVPQRYINKNRVRYRYLDIEVSCQQHFVKIFTPPIIETNIPVWPTQFIINWNFTMNGKRKSRPIGHSPFTFIYFCLIQKIIVCWQPKKVENNCFRPYSHETFWHTILR